MSFKHTKEVAKWLLPWTKEQEVMGSDPSKAVSFLPHVLTKGFALPITEAASADLQVTIKILHGKSQRVATASESMATE